MKTLAISSLGVCSALAPARIGTDLPGLDLPMPLRWAPPSGFTWSPAFAVIEAAPGVFTLNLEPTSLRVAVARVLYVDGDVANASASDANAGTDPALPLKSISAALNKWNVAQTIYVKAGFYPVGNSWSSGVPFGADVNVIGVTSFATLQPGRVISSVAESGLTWSVHSTGVHKATLAAKPYAVISSHPAHAPVDGGVAMLTETAAPLPASMAPGEWKHTGGVLYVATYDGESPTGTPDTYRALRDSVRNGWVNTALSMCVENLTFEGGADQAFWMQNIATGTFVDCTFTGGKARGCELNVGGAVTNTTHNVNLIRCRAVNNAGDGFGATVAGTGEAVRWLEWGCVAQGNSGAVSSDQGSSMHKSAGNGVIAAIRVAGRFASNKSQAIADVGGCETWCVGVRCAGEAVGFFCGDAGSMWLHGCVTTGTTTDLKTDAAGGTIRHHDTQYATTAGAGTVARYAP